MNIVEKVEPKDYATCFPNPISEDNLRYLKVRFHCLQSLYDTYVSETEIEYLDEDLPPLRGHISIVFHLLEIATYLVHYYERHLNVHTGDSTLRRKPVIAPKTLLAMMMKMCIRDSVQVVLAERNPVVFETAHPLLVPVPAQNTVFFGNPNHPLNAWQRANLLDRQRFGIADQIDFRQSLLGRCV